MDNNLYSSGGREQQCFIKIFSQFHQCFADLHLIQTLFQFHITSHISASVLFRRALSMAGHNLGHYISLWAAADTFFYLSYSTAVKSAHGQQEFITFFPQWLFFFLFSAAPCQSVLLNYQNSCFIDFIQKPFVCVSLPEHPQYYSQSYADYNPLY